MDTTFAQTTDRVAENYGPEHVDVPYARMVEVFGEPNSEDDPSKTDVAWDVTSPAGAVHIYNYKNGPAYNGEGTIEEIDSFSVQGESEAAVLAAVAAAVS